jgi:c-di-AMP phosphodiesterase-like protein
MGNGTDNKFLQFQKDRTQKGEITAATLRNFVKSIKLFCRHFCSNQNLAILSKESLGKVLKNKF